MLSFNKFHKLSSLIRIKCMTFVSSLLSSHYKIIDVMLLLANLIHCNFSFSLQASFIIKKNVENILFFLQKKSRSSLFCLWFSSHFTATWVWKINQWNMKTDNLFSLRFDCDWIFSAYVFRKMIMCSKTWYIFSYLSKKPQWNIKIFSSIQLKQNTCT